MGGHAREPSGGLRLGLLVAIVALFALIPAAQASAEDFTLTVNVVGEGYVECEAEFEVEEEPEFIFEECQEEQEFPEGTEVFLLAVELSDEFKEFKGCELIGSEECKVTMDEDHAVTAVFGPAPVNENTLSITIDGAGSGQVECELEEGPEPCQSIYPEETEFFLTEVTLVPVEDEGSEFAGFSGDCSGLVCTLTMDEDHEVTLTFNLKGGGGNEESKPPPGPAGPTSPLLPGKVRVGGAGLYRAGKATLRLTCTGGGPCKGTVKLIATLKAGKKPKKATVGKAAFSLPANGSKTIAIKLSAPAKQLLGRGGTLIAKARGDGVVASKVKITPSAR